MLSGDQYKLASLEKKTKVDCSIITHSLCCRSASWFTFDPHITGVTKRYGRFKYYNLDLQNGQLVDTSSGILNAWFFSFFLPS